MTNEPDYAEALRLIRKHKQPGDTIGKMFMRVAKALEEKPEQLGHLQARGRHYDIIQEAIATYDDYMLDDDYDAQRTLDKIVKRMRERVVLTDAPKNHLPDLPQPTQVTADQAAEDVRREREAKAERDRYAKMTTAEKCAVQGDGFINDYD